MYRNTYGMCIIEIKTHPNSFWQCAPQSIHPLTNRSADHEKLDVKTEFQDQRVNKDFRLNFPIIYQFNC